MRTQLVLIGLGAGLLLAGLLAFWLSWPDQGEPAGPGPNAHVPTGPQIVVGDSENSIDRDPAGQAPDKASFTYWRDYPNLAAVFASTLQRIRSGGGDQHMIDYILERTRDRKGTVSGERVASMVKKISESKMLSNYFPEGAFSELLYGADFTAGNFLQAQINNYLSWESRYKDPDYKYDLNMMRFEPLEYPPEMFVHFFSPGVDLGSLEPGFWTRLAELRNFSLQLHADLYQEEFILDYSVQKTIVELGIRIPTDDKDEAYRLLIPGYASIRDQIKQISAGYPAEVRRVMLDLGYPVEKDLW